MSALMGFERDKMWGFACCWRKRKMVTLRRLLLCTVSRLNRVVTEMKQFIRCAGAITRRLLLIQLVRIACLCVTRHYTHDCSTVHRLCCYSLSTWVCFGLSLIKIFKWAEMLWPKWYRRTNDLSPFEVLNQMVFLGFLQLQMFSLHYNSITEILNNIHSSIYSKRLWR